jgi:hypothetical protein
MKDILFVVPMLVLTLFYVDYNNLSYLKYSGQIFNLVILLGYYMLGQSYIEQVT